MDIPVSFNATVQYVIYCFDIERFAKLLNCSKSGIIIVCPFHSQCFQYSYMSVRLPKAHIHRTYTLKGCVVYILVELLMSFCLECDCRLILFSRNINNGVYRAGFARTQEAYDEAVIGLFDALDKVI